MNGLLPWFRQTHVLQRMVLLLAFVMLTHCFDTCSAHVAGVGNTLRTAPGALVQVALTQATALDTCGTPGNPVCEICHPQESHRDICEVTSDTVTPPSSDCLELAPRVFISLPMGAVIPDIIDLMPVVLALPTRAAPDVPTLFSTLCRNPLAGRAPPASV